MLIEIPSEKEPVRRELSSSVLRVDSTRLCSALIRSRLVVVLIFHRSRKRMRAGEEENDLGGCAQDEKARREGRGERRGRRAAAAEAEAEAPAIPANRRLRSWKPGVVQKSLSFYQSNEQ